MQGLAVRVPGDQARQLRDQLGGRSQLEVGGEPPLERLQAKLLEALRLRRRERRVAQVGESGPTPERERLAEKLRRDRRARGRAGALEQMLEAPEIELALTDLELVAGAPRAQPLPPEEPAQAVHGDLDRVLRGAGRPLAPERVDDALSRHDLVRVQEEQREQRALAQAARRKRRSVPPDLEGPQQPELEDPAAVRLHALSLP